MRLIASLVIAVSVAAAAGRLDGPSGEYVFHRGPRRRHRRAGRGRAEPLVLGGADRPLGGVRRRRGGHAVVRGAVLRPARAGHDARRQDRAGSAGRAAGGGRAARGAPGRDGRRQGQRRHLHRQAGHPRRGRPGGQGLRRAGEPDGEGHRVAGDGARVRGREGRSRGADARRARRRGGGGRRHPRPAVGGDRRGEGDAQRPAVGGPHVRPSRRGSSRSPGASCAAWSACSARTTG